MTTVRPALNPSAHRAAIDALEAQRAAYRRVARSAESQQAALSGGDVERAATLTDGLSDDVAAAQEGARQVRTLVDDASKGASPQALHELERRMDEMMREARTAEVAIHNLTSQLEAWRDAYGRQLTDEGLVPGGDSGDAPPAPRPAYERPGFGAHSAPTTRLIDRKG